MSEQHGLVDKSKWGPGPWQQEPDRVEWRKLGYPCLITRNDYPGNLCGYVAVPEGHPWHGKQAETIDADAHGGLNFTGPCHTAPIVCHVPEPGESDSVWWVGFHCGHGFDLMPGLIASMKENGQESWKLWIEWEYRTVEYVRANVEALALQAVAAV